MKHTDRNRKNIGNCNWLRRALPVVLSALLLCSLTGCSVRDLHIGQVEVNTGIATAWITPAKGVDKFAIAAGDFSVRDDGTVTYTGTAYRALQGIDVSTFQQEIDWQAVADSGIDFAFIRAGYRGYGKGGIVEDDRFRQNVAGARAAAFCAAVEAAGYDAAVYGNRWQGDYDYDFTQLRDYAFWVSAPGTADDFYYAHDFWQYSYQGTVPGITGHVDRDLWFVPITT